MDRELCQECRGDCPVPEICPGPMPPKLRRCVEKISLPADGKTYTRCGRPLGHRGHLLGRRCRLARGWSLPGPAQGSPSP